MTGSRRQTQFSQWTVDELLKELLGFPCLQIFKSSSKIQVTSVHTTLNWFSVGTWAVGCATETVWASRMVSPNSPVLASGTSSLRVGPFSPPSFGVVQVCNKCLKHLLPLVVQVSCTACFMGLPGLEVLAGWGKRNFNVLGGYITVI